MKELKDYTSDELRAELRRRRKESLKNIVITNKN